VSGVSGDGRPSVVLVDDSRDVRTLVRRRLQASGFDVVGEGEDGDEAIILAHRHQPALLVLDTSMPRVDGIEALPVILAVSPATKVVIFTGFEEPGLAERARELGAADFVEKSIRLEHLPGRLTQSLETAPISSSTPARPPLSVVQDLPADVRSAAPARASAEREQAVLSEHVQQFRELFDLAEIGMATLTSNGTVVRANQALAQLMSCSPSDLVGVDYGRLTVGRAEDLDRRLEDICDFGEDLTSFEHHLPTPPGEPPSRIVRVTLAPIRDAGRQVLYVFAQVQDVTAQRAIEGSLRRSEENFRQLVTAVSEYAIFMLDRDGHVVSWNSGAERIKGYAAHEIVGRHFRLFYPAEEQATGHPEHNLEIALRRGTFGEEGWRVRKDGSRFWASVVISPIHDDHGRHVGFAKVTRDQTEQRRHEDERRRLLEQRIHLLGVTAHELRSPIAVIDGSAGTLETAWNQISADERGELVRSIRSSADRLRRLGVDLTTTPQAYGETVQLRLEQTSLTQILRDGATRLRAVDADVQLVLDVPSDTALHADAGRLAQAVDNLLDNAVRHGTPPVCLSGVVDDQVHIRVSDAGAGIPGGLVPRLFERFAMAGPTAGTGLGLYLVREIARAHGGEAEYLPATTGEPAAFEIRLPRT
jgi:PAS domain S-box-containing protein